LDKLFVVGQIIGRRYLLLKAPVQSVHNIIKTPGCWFEKSCGIKIRPPHLRDLEGFVDAVLVCLGMPG